MNIGNYLFGFSGRINRAKWWLFVLVIIVYTIVMQYVVLRNMGVGLWVYLALQIPLWYMSIAVGIKRLHDRNKPDWWAGIFYGIPIAISIYMTYLTWGLTAAANAITTAATPEEMQAAVQAAQNAAQGTLAGMGSMYWVLVCIELIVAVWALVELGILKGTTGDNTYGPDPLAGK